MSKIKVYKCSYKNCQHDEKEIAEEFAVKVGARYMHRDCSINSKTIEEIKRFYFDNISNTVVMAQLGSTINNIIFKKNVNAEYLLFALKMAKVMKIKINTPYSLHYLIDNQRIKKEWSSTESRKMIEKMKREIVIGNNPVNEVKFNYISDSNDGFGSILGGL